MLTSCVAIAYFKQRYEDVVFLICQGIRQTDRILFLCIIAEDLNLNISLKDIFKVVVPYLHLRVPGLRDMSKKDTLDRCPFM